MTHSHTPLTSALSQAHPSWHACLQRALAAMEPAYLEMLAHTPDWLPGPQAIFRAFSLPVTKTKYILFGESPYPRAASANGYAFWDNAVTALWSDTGLDKKVNRATSLRNLIKLLLVAEGLLQPNQTGQTEIAKVNKKDLIKTNKQLFDNFTNKGFLLLNASLVLRPSRVKEDALQFQPFLQEVLTFITKHTPTIELILWGKIAEKIQSLTLALPCKKYLAEHPYNLSFIHNTKMRDFFQPLHLLLL